MAGTEFDVAIIGGGVVGSAILWELAKYDLRLILLEQRSDIADGTSKANSGIAHSGFDARPGTLEARLVTASNGRFADVCATLQVPYRRCGAIMLALSEEDLQSCEGVLDQAQRNGVTNVRRMRADEILDLEPNVNPQALGGLYIPGESITCSPRLSIAFAESAILNGAQVSLQEPLLALASEPDGLLLTTPQRSLRARWAINAAGLQADAVARLVGDESFDITPRRGEFYILDRREGHLLSHIILPVPTPTTKGILVAPTVGGNLLLGPTVDDMLDKHDVATSVDGLRRVAGGVQKLMPQLEPERKTITQFSGLRSVCSTGVYEIRPSERCPRLILAAGIRSTGMSAAPEIASFVRDLLAEQGLALRPRPGYRAERPAIKQMRDASPAEAKALYATDERYGHLVCRCEQISEAEIVQAIHAPLPATSVDAIKRRLRAGMGRCQGGFCGPRVIEILARELGVPLTAVRKGGPGSEILVEANKSRWM